MIYNAENHLGVACPRCSDGQTPEKMAAREISAGDAASMPSVPEFSSQAREKEEKEGKSWPGKLEHLRGLSSLQVHLM